MFAGLFKKTGSGTTSAIAGSEQLKDTVYNNFKETDKIMSDSSSFSQDQLPDTYATSIGADTTLQGDLDVKGQLNIYGVVEGQIRCDSEVFIGETGRVSGDVLAMNIRVSGYLEGTLECGELTILHSGKVTGEASTDSFMIEEGGEFEGNSRRRTADNVTQLKRGGGRVQALSEVSSRAE